MQRRDARRRLDDRLVAFRDASTHPRPPRGWIRAVRDALGMSSTELAARAGVDQSRVPRVEQGEVDATVTLATMEKFAAALDCTFVYALVPTSPLQDLVLEQARHKARAELDIVDHTMTLEDQHTSTDARLLDDLAAHWIDRRGLWS